jgi:hypothetical protein
MALEGSEEDRSNANAKIIKLHYLLVTNTKCTFASTGTSTTSIH